MGLYKIPCISPSAQSKYGAEREFYLLPLLPRVRRQLFTFFGQLLDSMDTEAVEKVRAETIDNANTATVLYRLVEYLIANDKLERLVSLLICPGGQEPSRYNPEEVQDFLENNGVMEVETQIIVDFFVSGSQEHTIRLFGMIYEHSVKLIQKIVLGQTLKQ